MRVVWRLFCAGAAVFSIWTLRHGAGFGAVIPLAFSIGAFIALHPEER